LSKSCTCEVIEIRQHPCATFDLALLPQQADVRRLNVKNHWNLPF
jgi:hypothetical protein